MEQNKTPLSQLKASREYRKRIKDDEEKKAQRNYLSSRRSARSFVNNKATLEDLEELEYLIEQRKKDLNQNG